MKSVTRLFAVLLLITAVLMPVIGQDNDNNTNTNTNDNTNTNTNDNTSGATPTFMVNMPMVAATDSLAFAVFAHAGTDSGPVDIYLDDVSASPVVANLAYGEATDVIAVPAGEHTLSVRGTGMAADSTPVVTNSWDFTGNSTWVIAVVGLQSTSSVQAEPITVIRTPLNGNARVRISNWVADVVPLNVTSDNADMADFAPGLGWAGVQDVEVAPGTFNLQVTGEDAANIGDPHSLNVAADMTYTVLLTGTVAGNQPLDFLVIELPIDMTRVQFVNERAEALDVFSRDADSTDLAAGNLASGGSSEWVSVPSTAVTFVGFAPGTGPTGTELVAFPTQLRPWRDVVVTFRADGTVDLVEQALTPMDAMMGGDGDNANTNTNDNANTNTNDNTDANTNTNANTNDNSNTNTNDNSGGGDNSNDNNNDNSGGGDNENENDNSNDND